MNFFERQEVARRQSRRLVWLFALAVLAIVTAVDLVVLVAFGGIGPDGPSVGALVSSTLVTLIVIASATMYRVSSLGAGGAVVARELGGTPLSEDTQDFHYRRLRNVVEEIAIASGVPVPEIYVLEQESGINAFAAGYAPSDAVVAVTRGALERLNRDELQGVIAHEFSHIVNGDMRLNIRLMGLLFGILVLGIAGRKILEHGRVGRSRDGAPLLVIALGLLVVGYVGLLAGRMIKAGVSRQREFLADASAVQFTRQTRGIAGALKKIGGLDAGARLVNRSQTEEVAHMLFGDGVGFSSLFATHPPLMDRIQALEPSFKPFDLTELSARWQMKPPSGREEDIALGLVAAESGTGLPDGQQRLAVAGPAIAARVARPQAGDYARAGTLTEAIPEVLRQAVHEHDEVVPLLLGLLHAGPGKIRDRQQFELRARHDELTARQALDYAERLADLPRILRLPLAALALPTLRRRPRAQLESFMDSCFALSHADGRIDLFEYCLGRLLRVQVRDALDPVGAWVHGSRHLKQVVDTASTLMAVLAQAGHENRGEAQRAYLAGLAHVFPRLNAPYLPPADPLRALDEVWPVLDTVEPVGKELLLEGLVLAISHDGRITVDESELLRAVCASLHVPLPPLAEPA